VTQHSLTQHSLWLNTHWINTHWLITQKKTVSLSLPINFLQGELLNPHRHYRSCDLHISRLILYSWTFSDLRGRGSLGGGNCVCIEYLRDSLGWVVT